MYKTLVILFILVSSGAIYGQDHNIPELNKKIVSYVESVIGTRVDRGECWDLANQALTRYDAEWDHQFRFGKRVYPSRDTIYPGDIIQFKNIKIKYREGNTIHTETMGQHTAIVYEVIGTGHYKLAHQNTGFSGRKVGVSELNLDHVVKGKMYFYRPVKE